jgi:hypothetical protein
MACNHSFNSAIEMKPYELHFNTKSHFFC